MGHRLSAIATRTGDQGTTGLGNGSRVSKADPRVGAMGDVDELNSAVGLLLAFGLPPGIHADSQLIDVQQDLLDLGGELSIPCYTLLKPERVAALDACLMTLNAGLPRLQEFVHPGGSIPAAQAHRRTGAQAHRRTGAQAHMCRTTCRRAERAVIVLTEVQAVSHTACQYLNRLSDLMFVLARVLNPFVGQAESMWNRERAA
jgi:cob(I)alamin adenosyltransferase